MQPSPKAITSYAIMDYSNVAWQPGDGRLLAFTGAINGPTSDLYLYDTQSGEFTQLTDGPSQAIAPSWSPDGQVHSPLRSQLGASLWWSHRWLQPA